MNGNNHPSRFLYNFQEPPAKDLHPLAIMYNCARGEPNEGACMYKFTVEAVVPSFRFLRPTVMKLRHRRRTMI